MTLTVTHSAFSESDPDEVWAVLINHADWPKWDKRLESVRASSTAKSGTSYSLKPVDGHEVTIQVTKAKDGVFTDVAKLEFGTIETERTVSPTKGGSIVTQTMRANINPEAVKTFHKVFWPEWAQGIIDSTKALAEAPTNQEFVSRHRNIA